MITIERFERKVDKAGDCWLWIAYIRRDGYGYFWVDGKMVYSHRFAYEHYVGPIPAGLQLDHLCRVRNCVRPSHLEPVTQQENVRRGEVGKASGALQLAKTHCPHGHPYDEINTYYCPNGRRQCRTCHAERERQRQAKSRKKAVA